MKISNGAKNAILLGALCSVSYFAVYIARNILGAVTPQMLADGAFDKGYIGNLSAVYLIFYAVGQLINGYLGDKIKAKYMISCGLLFAAVSNFVFIKLTHVPNIALAVYGTTGFFLAMIYGPMTKVVAENTEHIHAVRCSLGYTLASFLGSPAAGVLATFFVWQDVFAISSALLALMAIACFGFFLAFERRGIVKYNQFDTNTKGAASLRILIENRIIRFSLVSILTGVIRTSTVFWLPTYFAEALGYSESGAASIFTVGSVFISFATFIAVFLYERLNRDIDKTLLITFAASALAFVAVYFVSSSIINIILIVVAIIAADSAATMLWSIYCPGLKKTGKVSGATGFLDFLSYVAAALSNLFVANTVKHIGWSSIVLIWAGLMIAGIVVALPVKTRKKKD